jgi:hypothetical protein
MFAAILEVVVKKTYSGECRKLEFTSGLQYQRGTAHEWK